MKTHHCAGTGAVPRKAGISIGSEEDKVFGALILRSSVIADPGAYATAIRGRSYFEMRSAEEAKANDGFECVGVAWAEQEMGERIGNGSSHWMEGSGGRVTNFGSPVNGNVCRSCLRRRLEFD